MSITKLKNQIKNIVEKVIEKKVVEEDGLLDNGVLDSLATVRIITEIEDVFNISISNDDFTHYNFNSITAISELVARSIELA